ncbi:phosphoglucomutase [Cohnella sp. CIP 111063]|uniref:phospho-sugar mutase n=1 Tax=unclassified Cohnella TaxID=2636738 RepID=UPI000B8C1592|nr:MULTISPECIES: phospho-sugar mutase [unclassified Cohnella]OXS55937.1 phosphoglucomutase [Cohnella sp. CIP 111063]PRX67145.1 phosphoglucomutase [Cohnella sp. SGD-V74]
MSAVNELYQGWLNDANIDEATKEELRGIAGQAGEIEDRFYRELEFGTGGLRGVMGAGTNRMNRYVIGKATQGFANFLRTQSSSPSVVIAHDSRGNSDVFSLEAACVLAANGIRTYLFPSLRPTPQLSFAVRDLGATGGVVVTASHNPPEYNGYKVYGADGGQLVPDQAEQVISEIRSIASFDQVKRLSREEAEAQGLLVWLGEEADQRFVDAVAAQVVQPELIQGGAGAELGIVFTPLHGAGNVPIQRVLAQAGFTKVSVVSEQEQPDGMFPTVKSPNPEEQEAFTLAIKLAGEVGADLIIGTDPDCDRMGAVVKNDKGEFVVLTGNQSGALMVHYLLSNLKAKGKLPGNGAVIKTIVTSQMGADIAASYGCKVFSTLTGFKYIGELMTQFEKDGSHEFLFGYEESYGYLTGTYARDKDAVVASLLISEAAAYYKSQGKTLYDVLLELYAQYGTYLEKLESRTLKGKDGVAKIGAIMNDWREAPPEEIAGVRVSKVLDYSQGLDGLPAENVLKFLLEDDSWFCLRPSGTEPKIKIYFAVRGQGLDEASASLEKLTAAVMARVDSLA